MKKEKRKKKKETPLTQEEFIKRREIIARVKLIIQIISWILLFFFSWLNFKDFPYIVLLNDYFAVILLKISLALYYLSWILGTSFDLEDEEYTLLIAPNKGKITNMAVGYIIILGFLFAILCWAKDFRVFSISLFLFFLFDRLGNIYLVRYVRHAIDESKRIYIENKNFIGLFSIESIDDFLSGNYLKWRSGIGGIIILMIILFSFTDLSLKISTLLNVESQDLIITTLIFLYFVTVELVIWYKRIKRRIYLNLLSEINNEYHLEKKSMTTRKKEYDNKKNRYNLIIVPICTFIIGFFSILVLSVYYRVFWINSKYDIPLIYNMSVMIGDSILLPIINFKIFNLYFNKLGKIKLKKQFIQWIFFALTISILLNVFTHLKWINDEFTDFIGFSQGSISFVGYWHLIFSTVQMTILLSYPYLWYYSIKISNKNSIEYSWHIWFYFFLFSLLNIFDMLNKYIFIYNNTLSYVIKKEGFPFATSAMAIILLIIMLNIKKRK